VWCDPYILEDVLQRRLGITKIEFQVRIMWHGSHIGVTWIIHTCDMTHDSCILGDILQRQRCSTKNRISSKNYVTWLIHVCDMTQLHVWHDSFIPEYILQRQRLGSAKVEFQIWSMWHDSFTCETWLIHTGRCPSSTVWQRQSRVSSTKYVIWLIHACDRGWSGEGLKLKVET